MKKNFAFSEELDFDFDTVWQILQNPESIFEERGGNYKVISATEWVEHSNGIDNISHAVIDQVNHQVTVQTDNSKYDSETVHIVITLTKILEGCKLHVEYTVGTTAIFNILAFEVLGKKLIGHATNTIFKNIEKQLKK